MPFGLHCEDMESKYDIQTFIEKVSYKTHKYYKYMLFVRFYGQFNA